MAFSLHESGKLLARSTIEDGGRRASYVQRQGMQDGECWTRMGLFKRLSVTDLDRRKYHAHDENDVINALRKRAP